MFENPGRGRQARNFSTNAPKILDLKSSSEQIFPENCRWVPPKVLKTFYNVHVGGYVEVAVHEHQMYFFTKLKYLLCYTHFLNETPAQRWRNQLLLA